MGPSQTPHRLKPVLLGDGDLDGDGLAFAFAALVEPGGEAFGEAFGCEAEAGFEMAVGGGEGVVEVGGVCEIAHAELVEPLEGAGSANASDGDVDGKFLGVHEIRIAPVANDSLSAQLV
jgi:hypothetical protein